jgi:hypothetical protein
LKLSENGLPKSDVPKLDIPKLEVNLIFESRAAADAVSSWN